MIKSSLFLVAVVFGAANLATADEPLLAIPGKLILDAKLDSAPAAPWKAAKGEWQPVDGALRGSELEADKHGAVLRATQTLTDCIVQVEVKFDGAKSTTLSMNAVKDHMARIILTPTTVTVQRDDNDHEGPDKGIVFHRVKAEVADGGWHTVRMEMVGDTLLGKVDGIIGHGSNALFTQPKASPGVTVAGQSVQFRNFKIWEATKNPKWDEVKAGLKNEVLPAPAKGKAKGKGKAKAKAAE
jgi:hypothetical protein